MKERPILFNGEMVRAILDGRKTHTRRALSPQPDTVQQGLIGPLNGSGNLLVCKHGQPGDRLWVRETWARYNIDQNSHDMAYRATTPSDWPPEGLWRPSIHMPRWASRITLEITGVRIERLQDITEGDAKQEGVEPISFEKFSAEDRALLDYPLMESGDSYRNGFAFLWESINGPGSWAKNPWVWVIEFKRRKP